MNTKLPQGYLSAGNTAGIKESGKPDLGLIYTKTPANYAGTYTKNSACAACVTDNKQLLGKKSPIKAILVNSGNANACTGDHAMVAINHLKNNLSPQLNISPTEILTASTGIIGIPLPYERITATLPALIQGLTDNCTDFANSIMTTDTRPKSISLPLGNQSRITGITKGAGMIHPNMATMLGFVLIDGIVDADTLQLCLTEAVNKSFNQISIDGDTSTNDMAILLANGASGEAISADVLQPALDTVCIELAQMIARDGEGANRIMEIIVTQAQTQAEAIAISRGISRSMLVKSALHGADPNWGRIVASAGQYGQINLSTISLSIMGVVVFAGGIRADYDDMALSDSIQETDTVQIILSLGHDTSHGAIAWGCDLSADYVSINADYRLSN